MAIEQAIFTSCRTGIERSTSGFQVYSYSCSMKNILDHTSAGGLITYEPPTEGLPLQPSIEEARMMYPRKFAFAQVEKNRGMVCFACNTYLGKDYEEDSTRYGNYLCHLVSCNEVELSNYPCTYMDSSFFRTSFSTIEATSTSKPEQLPRVQTLEGGETLTYETIREFINHEEEIELVKYMLLCVLQYDTSEVPKKLLICDESERIPYWIGAITMVLPLNLAKKLSFSFYEYDPLSSPCQIIGVYKEGTKYDSLIGSLKDDFYLFDFCHGIYPDFTKEEYQWLNDEFFEVVELSYGISKECMERFHTFLDGYTYRVVNMELLDAYHLYVFMDGLYKEQYDTIKELSQEEVERMFTFAKKYMTENTRREFITDMIHLVKQTTCNIDSVIKEATTFLVQQVEERKVVRDRVVNPLYMKFYYVLDTYEGSFESFQEFYKSMDQSFKRMGVEFANYVFINTNKEVLIETIRSSKCEWVPEFFLTFLIDNIRREQINPECLDESKKHGGLLKAIIKKTMNGYPNKRSAVVKQSMEKFKFDLRYMTYVYINMEKWLYEEESSKAYVTLVRREYENYFTQLSKVQRYNVYKLLQNVKESKRIADLIGLLYERVRNFEAWFVEVKEFISSFRQLDYNCIDVLYEYSFENALKDREHVYQNMLELFDYASEQNYKNSYRNTLVPYITGNLPLIATEERDKYIINQLYESQRAMVNKKIDIRVSLGHLYNCLEERVKELPQVTKLYQLYEHRINVTVLQTDEVKLYLEAVAVKIGTLIFYTQETPLLKELFIMTEKQQITLIEEAIVPVVKLGKKFRNYEPLVKLYFYAISLEIDILECISANIRAYGVKQKDVECLIKEHRLDWLDVRYRNISLEQLCNF